MTYVDLSVGLPPGRPDAVIVTDSNRERVRPLLDGYVGYRFHLREWWVVDYGALTPRAAWRWFLRREPWNPRGAIDQWLYVRKGVPELGVGLPATPPR